MQEAACRARMLSRNFAQEGISLEGKTVLRTSDLHRLSAAVAAQIEAVTRHREALERHPLSTVGPTARYCTDLPLNYTM
jgi:hypothetical protein